MIAFLLSPLGKAAGALLLGAALVAGVYAYAYQRGAASERAAILERSVELLRERNETDDQISRMDDADLCRSLGGMPVDGRCE